jgi:hypothetical protein
VGSNPTPSANNSKNISDINIFWKYIYPAPKLTPNAAVTNATPNDDRVRRTTRKAVPA